jgi:PadR family transcriptional regulator, regulatory protein PadR
MSKGADDCMTNRIDREIRLAFWKIHILHHADQHDVYGLWLLEELAEHGHALSPGTLYPALARMEANGWLRRSGPSNGVKARRSYRATAAGRRVLRLVRDEIEELYREIVLDARAEERKRARRKA